MADVGSGVRDHGWRVVDAGERGGRSEEYDGGRVVDAVVRGGLSELRDRGGSVVDAQAVVR